MSRPDWQSAIDAFYGVSRPAPPPDRLTAVVLWGAGLVGVAVLAFVGWWLVR